RRQRVIWDDIFVECQANRIEHLFGNLAVDAKRSFYICYHHMVVSAVRYQAKTALHQLVSQAARVFEHLLGVLLEFGSQSLPKSDSLSSNSVHVRPALNSRKYSAVNQRRQIIYCFLNFFERIRNG